MARQTHFVWYTNFALLLVLTGILGAAIGAYFYADDVKPKDRRGFINYNDASTTVENPLELPGGEWVRVPNDGKGPLTIREFAPKGVNDLLNVEDGSFTFKDLKLGDSVLIRNDYNITTTVNNTLLEQRYVFGNEDLKIVLSSIINRLDDGAKEYKFALRSDFLFVGSDIVKDNPIYLEIRTSEDCTLVNSGCVVNLLPRGE